MIKTILKYVLRFFLIVFAIGSIAYLFIDESRPVGTKGLEAERLTDEMLAALNKNAFDSISFISFTFREKHSYEWDKKNDEVIVKWDDNIVKIPLDQGEESYNEIQKQAYAKFINDSFWLIAPYKVRDNGTIRSMVDVKEGRGLLIEYTSGGLTPGDAYLWIIDDKGFPKSWKLWTSNIPFGGLSFTWDGWISEKNAWFSTAHSSKILEIPITVLSIR